MLVRAKETCIVASVRWRAGSEFEWAGDKLPRYLEPVDAKPEPVPDEVIVAGKRGRRSKTIHDEVL